MTTPAGPETPKPACPTCGEDLYFRSFVGDYRPTVAAPERLVGITRFRCRRCLTDCRYRVSIQTRRRIGEAHPLAQAVRAAVASGEAVHVPN